LPVWSFKKNLRVAPSRLDHFPKFPLIRTSKEGLISLAAGYLALDMQDINYQYNAGYSSGIIIDLVLAEAHAVNVD